MPVPVLGNRIASDAHSELLVHRLKSSGHCRHRYNRAGLNVLRFHRPTQVTLQQLATGCTVRGSNPRTDKTFHTRPDRPWGLIQPPVQWEAVLLPGCKAAGSWQEHPPSSSAAVKERVQLYLNSLSGPSWPAAG